MATSGSTDFGMTAREVIEYALQKINVLGETESAGADSSARAMRELNVMLKGWQKYENLWRLTEGTISLVEDDSDYALSPVPHKIISARYRNSDGNEIVMNSLNREEYYNIPDKTTTGSPLQYYADYQRAAVTLYTWPVIGAVTTETIRYTYFRKFEDIDDLANDIDVKQEHLEVVGYNLAARLADDYGRSGTHIDRIIARAQILLDQVLDEDREDYIQFVPDYP